MNVVFLLQQSFTIRRPSSLTRHCSFRVPPIDENSLLLPPVGVWAVSQSQCGRPPSQAGYASSPWWAVTSPTKLMHRRSIHVHGLSHFNSSQMLVCYLSGFSIRFQKFPGTWAGYLRVTHPFATRFRKQAFLPLVRLACIRHAASVHPEPGSNSPFDLALRCL